jgi:hypothetical protein
MSSPSFGAAAAPTSSSAPPSPPLGAAEASAPPPFAPSAAAGGASGGSASGGGGGGSTLLEDGVMLLQSAVASGLAPRLREADRRVREAQRQAAAVAAQARTAGGRAALRAEAEARLEQTRGALLQRPEQFSEARQLRELERALGGFGDEEAHGGAAGGGAGADAGAVAGAGDAAGASAVLRSASGSFSGAATVDAAALDGAFATQPPPGASGPSSSSSSSSSAPGGAAGGAAGGAHFPPPAPAPPLPPRASAAAAAFDDLSVRQKIWLLLDDPTSSRAAQLIAAVVMVLILVSCTAFVVQTLPEYMAQDEGETNAWSVIERVCVAVFSLEFALRAGSCPDAWAFARNPLNAIDFVAVLPFYLELVLGASAGGGAVVRIVRLVRVFRVFKISRYLPWVRVFSNALLLSLAPLVMLVLVVALAVVIFSSVMYYAERGEWDEAQGRWVRVNPLGDGTPEVSPYQSIPASFWWCIVTLTTVGYGDETPYTAAGKLIAAVASLTGILVVAIPVSVISTNFNAEFLKLQRQREQVKARMALLRRHFREARSGLGAVLDEVDAIVKRNTGEFQGELEALFEQARSELTEELQEVLRMAYERRRQLHLAAIAAGQLQAAAPAGARGGAAPGLGGAGLGAGAGAGAGGSAGPGDVNWASGPGRPNSGSIADGSDKGSPDGGARRAGRAESVSDYIGIGSGGFSGGGAVTAAAAAVPRFSGRAIGGDAAFSAELAQLSAPAPARPAPILAPAPESAPVARAPAPPVDDDEWR